ncbi:UNVERIFIED_CONTAM: hypothetical protein FKN15_075807 [Acipenser sinensis]
MLVPQCCSQQMVAAVNNALSVGLAELVEVDGRCGKLLLFQNTMPAVAIAEGTFKASNPVGGLHTKDTAYRRNQAFSCALPHPRPNPVIFLPHWQPMLVPQCCSQQMVATVNNALSVGLAELVEVDGRCGKLLLFQNTMPAVAIAEGTFKASNPVGGLWLATWLP